MTDFVPDEPEDEFRPGDWVKVWARVQDRHTHPEDLTVSVDSHNASPNAIFDVRRDWVIKPEGAPSFAERCPALYYAPMRDGYVRCQYHEGHSAKFHRNGGTEFDDASVAGYFEGK